MSIKKRATYNRKRNSEILANMAAPPAPTAPATVQPFATADDMLAVNDWLTNFTTQMEDIDFGIGQLETDTKYQKGQNDRQAVENRSASDDAMAARGVFSSSLRDAAVMDVEATRSLANTYLDTKLAEAITTGTTRKNTLATAKTNFETGMLQIVEASTYAHLPEHFLQNLIAATESLSAKLAEIAKAKKGGK